MHDAAYKGLFSHRPMVEDLLRGFVAREWSDKLDFETLEKLPADYVSDDLLQRHGDSVWRLRLQGQGEAWLYLLVMLEFQSTTDPFMAVRVLVYTGLLYQDLIRRGALDEAGRLPAVLPVVLYNGPERWTAPVEVGGPHRAGGGGRWRPSSHRSGTFCLTRGDGGRTICRAGTWCRRWWGWRPAGRRRRYRRWWRRCPNGCGIRAMTSCGVRSRSGFGR